MPAKAATKKKVKKTKKAINVDRNRCVGCSYCKLNCPSYAIEVVDAIASPTSKCTKCGVCLWVCPVGAISQAA